jgi:hypothetical protein
VLLLNRIDDYRIGIQPIAVGRQILKHPVVEQFGDKEHYWFRHSAATPAADIDMVAPVVRLKALPTIRRP